ncbi:hypothetical protein MKEN_00678900 [Mycena kentingensis (nom. inval.)]|nr:hypothetical protein MKEN_00678900 [Mycena kentingensis (nom. inval.)]
MIAVSSRPKRRREEEKELGRQRAQRKRRPKRTSKEKKDYAVKRGSIRGSTKKKDELTTREQPPIDPALANEGLIPFLQTTLCRRLVWKEIYSNKELSQCTGACCDVCNPELFDRTRPGAYKARSRRSTVKKGEPSVMVQERLVGWRTVVKKRDFRTALWSAEGILPLETIIVLSSVGPIQDRVALDRVLAGQWKWEERYGEELLAFLKSFEMPAFQPLPKKKRKAPAASTSDSQPPAAKRARTMASATPLATPAPDDEN